MRILVIGGGIGGLTTTIALRKAGFDAVVFERAPKIQEVGAGITLWNNAMSVLEQLGVGESVRSKGRLLTRGTIGTSHGKSLVSMDYEQFSQYTSLRNTVAIHRAALVDALAKQIPHDAIILDSQCVAVEQSEQSVTARFANDTTYSGDLLIGADGIHSVVRSSLWGEQAHRYSGYTAWRGIAPFPATDLKGTGEFWGAGERFGVVPIQDNMIYWFATANVPQGGQDSNGRKAALLQRFGNWAWGIPEILEATPEEAMLRNDIIDLPPTHPWSKGRVVLLGDAIHPTTPNMGQGACMAIESALALANALVQHNDHTAAFQAYETARFDRTSMITKRSWMIGKVGQWSNPIACWLRNGLARLAPSSRMITQLIPVIEHDIKRLS